MTTSTASVTSAANATSEKPQPQPALIDGWLAALNVEAGLYLLIGLVALGIRLAGIGNNLLTEAEAHEAIAAWRFASMSPIAAAQPVSAAWFTLTAFLFWIAGASEFWARFWPALAGTALVFTPMIFRRELGRGVALAASGLLAISGVLIAASRMAGGTTLAALSLVLLIAGLKQVVEEERRAGLALSGLALGLGLASGPRFLSGAAAMLLALLLIVFVRPELTRNVRLYWRATLNGAGPLLIAAGTTFGLVASAALVNPAGLSAAGAALPTWLMGWAAWPGAQPAWLAPQLLFIHEPLLWVMSIGGVYIGFLSGLWNSLANRFQMITAAREAGELEPAFAGGGASELEWRGTATALVSAALGALLFTILYPAREASDAMWVVIPLTMLAGKLLVETFSGEWFEGELETVLAQAGVLFVMLVFIYFQLAAYGRGFILVVDRPIEVRLMLAGGVAGLAIFVTVMFALGWSRLSAARGALLALGLAALIAMLGSSLGLTFWRAEDPNNLWSPTTTASNLRLLTTTLNDIALRTVGKEEDLEIVVVSDQVATDRDGLLGWELRHYYKTRFVDSVALAKDSPVIITSSGLSEAGLALEYVGERFPLQTRQLLSPPTFQSLINWWLFRTWPTEYSRSVDLWVRPDIHNLIQQR